STSDLHQVESTRSSVIVVKVWSQSPNQLIGFILCQFGGESNGTAGVGIERYRSATHSVCLVPTPEPRCGSEWSRGAQVGQLAQRIRSDWATAKYLASMSEKTIAYRDNLLPECQPKPDNHSPAFTECPAAQP